MPQGAAAKERARIARKAKRLLDRQEDQNKDHGPRLDHLTHTPTLPQGSADRHHCKEDARKPKERINKAQSVKKAKEMDEHRDMFTVMNGMCQEVRWMNQLGTVDFETEASKRYRKLLYSRQCREVRRKNRRLKYTNPSDKSRKQGGL